MWFRNELSSLAEVSLYQVYFGSSDVAQRLRILLSNTHVPVDVFRHFYLMLETDVVTENFLKFTHFLNIEDWVVLSVMYHRQNHTQLVLDLLHGLTL